MKCIMLCIGVCSSSPSSHFSASLIQNISKFPAKRYFVDHQTANAIQLFVPIKTKFFRPLFFQNNLFICVSLKLTLSSDQKPVYPVKILVSEQIALAAVLPLDKFFFSAG